MTELHLTLRRHVLAQDAGGHVVWQQALSERALSADRVAIVICDMWDRHWSRGAAERVDAMAPRMDAVVRSAREMGVHIIHAPSDTLAFYDGTPARARAQAAPVVDPPGELAIQAPPLPIDDSDEGSDTGETETAWVWTRQHPAIEIDHDLDAITDDGREVVNLLELWQVEQVLLMGVHTNMCILNRSFGIKQMVRWGVPIALVRDLTDTMYNPARSPYVDHDEGTRLVIGYIERFWCPTILSKDLLAQERV